MGTGGTAGTADSPTKRDLHRVTTQEKLFQSEFNAPAGHCSVNAGEVRWTLRGYLPPKHLRIPGYNYGLPEDSQGTGFDECSPSIVGKESTRELMAGVFLPNCGDVDMTDNSSNGESRARHPAAPLAPKRADLPDIKTQKPNRAHRLANPFHGPFLPC